VRAQQRHALFVGLAIVLVVIAAVVMTLVFFAYYEG
jgi:hypothetical protein